MQHKGIQYDVRTLVSTLHFCLASATASLQSMLSSYPGLIQLVTIQVTTPDKIWNDIVLVNLQH